jgi:hypothetical protein
MKTKTLAYLAHPLGPYGPQRDANREAASKIMAELQAEHKDRVFIASWITLSGQWSETPENRKLGLECDLAALEHCQEIWLAGPEISKGMRIELDHAMGLGLRVIDLTHTLDRKTVIARSSPFNARYLTAIESRIWATTYGSQYASGQLPIRCAEMANTAVTDFRALYPETE